MTRRLFVLACATVMEEMIPLMSEGMEYEVLDFGLHIRPEQLRQTLQRRIDALEQPYDAVILGYGLCSHAVIGIRARHSPLVIPRVDDCIAIFLGSRAAHRAQHAREPGTYYLTKGWIEVGDTPFAEYERMVQQYGRERADRLIRIILAHYTRLALINTGQYELEKYREYARRTAEQFGLRYEEIPGSTALIRKMLYGPWDPDEFVVVPPGGTVCYEDFYPSGPEKERDLAPKPTGCEA
ncbi:MAG: DUF1638 domain-containing protein [Anaerolineae bacterium]|nr:DUF1638 domain-containing protein [Anaerolineae bacterium]MDW8068020.1 DUF1638 domain-containing protein [Anaerolineae bacterium]